MTKKFEKMWKLTRFGQEDNTKPEQDAMLAGAGGKDYFIKWSCLGMLSSLAWRV